METGQADPLFHQRIDLGEVPVDGVSAAAVHEEYDGVGVVKGGRIFRPAAAHHGYGGLQVPVVEIDGRVDGGGAAVEELLHQEMPGVEFMRSVAVAAAAGDHDDLLLVAELQPLEANVAELDRHRGPRVQLQGQEARTPPQLQGIVEHLAGDLAVDLVGELVALGNDPVGVPVLVLDIGLQLG